MLENQYRSLIKALSWRIVGTMDTFILSFVITGKIKHASAISAIELITKIALYYFHERIWAKISWGSK